MVMTHDQYLQRLRNKIRERTQLIQYMRINQVPFTRYDFLIYELQDLKIKLAMAEAAVAMESLRQITEN
jgi:hypothetical protein